ncbi:MAG TPA: YitT family protein, partial [Firmicutes bacterium]|nr:YitT family protein [Bacillota bacterium]
DYKKVVMVITDHPQEIADVIIKEVGRGVTFIHGQGAYTKKGKKLVYCVVKVIQLAKIKKIVEAADPQAFMTVMDAAEVLGRGFPHNP